MRKNRLSFVLVALILASLACGLFGGGEDAGSEGVAPSGENPVEESASSSGGDSGNYDTDFPLPPKVENFSDLGNDQINYQTPMKIPDVIEFYRGAFADAGYDERDILTVIDDTTFSMVWDGHPSGQAVVVQGVDLGNGTVNVNVRLEDV